jgi:hypothetical protein
MAYKIKRKSEHYWNDREIARLKQKYKKRGIPPFFELSRVGTRRASGISEATHTKGSIVQYKEHIAKVHKVTDRGLWVEPFKNYHGLAEPSGKVIFIPEKKVEHEVYPFYNVWLA